MPNPAFTVVLAIHRNPTYLPFSVASVLNQSCENFELFIVEDGAPEETHRCAEQLASEDERTKVFRYPKGERHGEGHRASALEEAKGEVITHINDDSLWFPDHLEVILNEGHDFDFGHTLHTKINERDGIDSLADFIENPKSREKMLSGLYNVANLHDVFYKRSAYEALPEGWAPAPKDVWTDLNMWRKFLRHPLKFGTIHEATALFLDYPVGHSSEESRSQMERWLNKIQTGDGRAMIRERVRSIQAHATLVRKIERVSQQNKRIVKQNEQLAKELSRLASAQAERSGVLKKFRRWIRGGNGRGKTNSG